MEQILISHEAWFRLGAFALILLLMLLWEATDPRRIPSLGWNRRLNNLALVSMDVVLVRLLVPVATATMAEISITRGWGLFNIVDAGLWPAFFLSLLLMDLLIYGQHVVMHQIPLLWRIHRLHHTDLDIDVTTALRFHPFEIILSMFLKLLFIALLGAPVVAVIVFEIILNISSMFNHSNIQIPLRIDRILRYFIVTPDMHRVHHSVIKVETNSNYGFNIPWWDYIFRNYRSQPAAGHIKMKIGLNEFRGDKEIFLHWLLLQPFVSGKKGSGEETLSEGD
ncbi:MAG: sterol desaturase family protein [Proteobacteria bacterium]|nr:sterol desaturase family protein [Pseudomonadota bacterium]